MKKMIFVAALLLGGCGPGASGPPPNYKIWIAPEIDSAMAMNGIAVWDELGARATLTADSDIADVHIVMLVEPACGDGNTIDWVGRTNQQTLVMTIRPNCLALWSSPEVATQTTIAHEYGHVLQLGHIPDDTPALMNAGLALQEPPAITNADRAEFADFWSVPTK